MISTKALAYWLLLGAMFGSTACVKPSGSNSVPMPVSDELSYPVCELLRISDDSLMVFVIKRAKFVVESLKNTAEDDSCALSIVSRIAKRQPTTPSVFIALDELSKFSDGYLSEALSSHAFQLFSTDLTEFREFDAKRPHSALRSFLTHEIAIELAVTGMSSDDFEEDFQENIGGESEARFVNEILKEVEGVKVQ